MNPPPLVPLEEIMATKSGSVDPSAFPDESFDLYSIPAFDNRKPEVLRGQDIGSSKQIVETGDVLLSKIVPHIRRAWVVGDNRGRRLIGSGEWIVFRSKRVHPGYLRHALVTDHFHQQFMSTVAGVGGSLLRARPSQVAKIKLPLPPLAEQKRIAAVLDKADDLRVKRRRALATLDNLLQSVFLDMFGDPEMNPKRWPRRRLGELLGFMTSGSRGWAAHYSETGALFLRIQNVGRNALLLDDIARVNAPDNAESRRTRVQEGDVLLSVTADLGRTGVIPADLGEAYINQHLVLMRPSGVEPLFLSAFLASPDGQRQLQRRDRNAVKAGLNFDDVRSVEVLLPPVVEQKRYASMFHAVASQRQRLVVLIESTNALFASLQAAAFAGTLFDDI